VGGGEKEVRGRSTTAGAPPRCWAAVSLAAGGAGAMEEEAESQQSCCRRPTGWRAEDEEAESRARKKTSRIARYP
jgi:hypothetical protein